MHLGWLPGEPRPDTFYATVDGEQWDEASVRSAVTVPDLSIDAIVLRYELTGIRWAALLRDGAIGSGNAWEKPPSVRTPAVAGDFSV